MLVWHCRTRQDSGQIVWHDFPKQVQRFLCCTSAVLCISHDTINEICIVDVYFLLFYPLTSITCWYHNG